MLWWREMCTQLDKQTHVILLRLEELFEHQQAHIVETVMNSQFAAPADHATLVGPPQPYKQAWEERALDPSVPSLQSRLYDLKVDDDSPSAQLAHTFSKHLHLGRGSSPRCKGFAGAVDVETQTHEALAGGAGLKLRSHWEEDEGFTAEDDIRQKREREMAESAKLIDVPTGEAATLAFVVAEEEHENVGEGGFAGWRGIVKSQRFDMISGGIITVNALVMIAELEWIGIGNGYQLGVAEVGASWPGAADGFLVLDHLFAVVFAAELALRVAAYGSQFFFNIFHWIDVLTVSLSIFELYVAPAMKVVLPNLTFMRLLRLARLAKVLRVVRVMRLFHQLRVIMVAIGSSMSALGWSIVFLTMVQAIAAILMTQLLAEYLSDPGNPIEVRRQAYHYFGRWTHAALTMYQMTLAPGPWGPIGRLRSLLCLLHLVRLGRDICDRPGDLCAVSQADVGSGGRRRRGCDHRTDGPKGQGDSKVDGDLRGRRHRWVWDHRLAGIPGDAGISQGRGLVEHVGAGCERHEPALPHPR